MASLYKKVIHGRPYWYLREMGWVDGKPKMVSERYVGTAADIEALLDGRAQAMVPERCRHLDFGAVAAVWGLLTDLKVADLVDEAAGAAPSGRWRCSTGSSTRAPNAGSPTGGGPRPRTGSPRSGSRRWTTAGSGTRCTRSPWTGWPGPRSDWPWRCVPGTAWTPAPWPWI